MARNALFVLIAFIVFSACKSPEARRPVQQNSGSFIKESVERNKKIYEEEKAEIAAIIASTPEIDYETSESGFWYYYQVKDTVSSTMPQFGDEIKFTYDVKNLDGTTIISEEEIGIQNIKVDQTNQDLISGLRDELKLMKSGERVTFLFPSYKAYGYYGIEDKLGANVPIKSTVTLQSIEQTIEN